MAKYRNRNPVEIEAVCWRNDLLYDGEKCFIPEWIQKAFDENVLYFNKKEELYLRSSLRDVLVHSGDMIVLDEKEIYRHELSTFKTKYERVPTAPESLSMDMKVVKSKESAGIDAVCWKDGFFYEGDKCCSPEWINELFNQGTMYIDEHGELYVKTSEGETHVVSGDTVIRARGQIPLQIRRFRVS